MAENILDQAQQYLKLGNVAKAASSFRHVLDKTPHDLTALMGLGKAQYRLRKFEAAKTSFDKILQVSPDHGQAYYGLGMIAEHSGRWPDAISFHKMGESYEALKFLKLAEDRFPARSDYRFMRGQLATSLAPSWHLPMLADSQRNTAYAQAIEAQIRPGDIVLDIGCGSGILAMMAVRAGAKHVYAIEKDKLLASAAKEIIELNGYGKDITIIPKLSSEIIVGKDIPEKADCLVTEIFDNALLGEGVLPILSHAWAHLLKVDARIIPNSGTLKGVLCFCPALETYHVIDKVCGFDLSPMEVMSHRLSYTDTEAEFAKTQGNHIKSAPFVIDRFNFQRAPALTFSNMKTIETTKRGPVNAILMWFDLQLSSDVVFSTQVTRPEQHWRQVTQLLDQKLEVKRGQSVKLNLAYDTYFDFRLM